MENETLVVLDLYGYCMLRVTVDVNGRDIGQVAAVNTTGSKTGRNTYEIYDVRSVEPGESVIDEGEFLATVTHRYEDGAVVLVERMMNALEELPG